LGGVDKNNYKFRYIFFCMMALIYRENKNERQWQMQEILLEAAEPNTLVDVKSEREE
jgi:hypothetical protein